MKMKRNVGNSVLVLLVVMTIIVWTVFPPQKSGIDDVTYARYHVGMTIGSLVIVLMSFSLFISTRPKWAEAYFGGLDKMYMTHRHTSTAAFLLMFIHLLIVPLHIVDLFIGNYLAIISFSGIIAIVLPTLAPRVPFLNKITGETYEGWKKLHKYNGIFFILGYVHSITVKAPTTKVAINWNMIFVVLGIASYVYTEFLKPFFKKHVPYTVEAVNRHNKSTTEVVMRPKRDPIPRQQAGQFLFVRFKANGLDEPHPFTISSAPHEDVLRVTIKATGDFTRHLYDTLQPGMDAVIEGAHGMFDYKKGGSKQIWLAGGIGITPFLSFIRDLKNGSLDRDVDFYYTVRHKEEAVFVEEIEEAARNNPRLKAYIRFSSVDGSLSIDHIVQNAGGTVSDRDVYMCGPLPMVKAFAGKFAEAGVPEGNIHFEEFNFR